MEKFHEKAAPFYLKGSDEGCLLIHGFTGTPAYLHTLGQNLHNQGYTVNNILLKGHGTTPEDLEKTTWEDWIASVEEGYRKLKTDCNKIYAMGLSMGGLLALQLAQQGKVDKVISMATPIKITNPFATLTPVLKHFIRFQSWKSTSSQRLRQLTGDKPIAYDVAPLASVHHLLRLKKQVEEGLPTVVCPALVMQPLLDRTVKPISGEIIYNRIASSNKEMVWLEKSHHTCTIGEEEEIIFNKIVAFLSKNYQ